MVNFRVGATDAEELVKELAPTFMEEDILNLPKFEFYIKLMIDGVASTPFSARGLMPLREDEKTHNFEKAVEWTRQNYAKKREIVEEEIMHSHFQEEQPPEPKPGKVINVSSGAPSFNRIPGAQFAPKAPVQKPPSSKPVAQEFHKPVIDPQVINMISGVAPKVEDKVEVPAIEQAQSFKKDILGDDSEEVVSGYGLNDAVCSSCGEQTKVPFKPDGTRPVYCKKCLSELKKKKKEDMAKNKANSSRPDFSSISPSALASSSSVEPVKPPALSLSALSGTNLVNFSKNAHNHKESPKEEEKPKTAHEKELEEGEDIIFE